MATIVQVVADGRPGGGTTAVLTLSALLAERGHRVLTIGQQDSYFLAQARRAGLDAVGIDFSSRATVPAATSIWRTLNRCRPDTVHAHGARAALPTLLAAHALGALRQRAALVYTVHGFHFVAKRGLMRWLARAAEAVCMRLADQTIFVSGGDRGVAQQHRLLAHARHSQIINNAVSVAEVPLPGIRSPKIGFLGRLTHQKNPLLLVDILLALRPLQARLEVIGGGPMEAELRARVDSAGLSGQVRFHGEQARDDALRLAADCSVLVLPSRWEGHPIALIEAMLLGLPVVASRVSGSSEIVLDGQTGYLVPADETSAYAERLRHLLCEPDLAASMGAHARTIAAASYSPQRLLDAHLGVYGIDGLALRSDAVPDAL